MTMRSSALERSKARKSPGLSGRKEERKAILCIRSQCDSSFSSERLGHPRRGRKPEFKQGRYPPLDVPACSPVFLIRASNSPQEAAISDAYCGAMPMHGSSNTRPLWSKA